MTYHIKKKNAITPIFGSVLRASAMPLQRACAALNSMLEEVEYCGGFSKESHKSQHEGK